MTLLQALNTANTLRPNAASDEIKVAQLYALEGEIALMFGVTPPKNPYDAEHPNDNDAELLMPAPFDQIYVEYLCAMIDLANEETILYENDIAVFNATWDRATHWYRRETRPRSRKNWKVM